MKEVLVAKEDVPAVSAPTTIAGVFVKFGIQPRAWLCTHAVLLLHCRPKAATAALARLSMHSWPIRTWCLQVTLANEDNISCGPRESIEDSKPCWIPSEAVR